MMDAAPNDNYLSVPDILEKVGYVENMAVLKEIMAKPKFDLNSDRSSGPMIFYVVSKGNVEGVKILLADPRVEPALSGANYNATLLSAVAGSHSAPTAKLLLADPRINPMGATDEGYTALHQAVLRGNVEVVAP